jgi:outer membrane protein assembly factor BamB
MMNALAAATPMVMLDDGFTYPKPPAGGMGGTAMGGDGTSNAGIHAAYNVAAALVRRALTGEGSFVDVSGADATVSAGWIGATLQDMDDRLADALLVPRATGAIVSAVDPSGPAAQAGLRPADVLETVAGVQQSDSRAFLRSIFKLPVGGTVHLTGRRDGKPLWKKEWTPQHIYLDFGTGSSPTVHDGRVYLLHDGEDQSYITALDAKTGREIWKTERAAVGFPKSSWMTPFVWKNAQRTEIVTTGHGFVISYDLEGKELWRVAKMAMPIVSPVSANGLLYVGTGSQGDANRPMYAIRPGASGDISLGDGATSSEHIVWSHPRASGYTPSALVYQSHVYLVHDTGILLVLDALTGKEIYKARVGGGGNSFSASPIGAGGRVYLLNEDGATFVLDASADEYKELGKNDLGEMSLASPAAAGGALYIRTQTKLYRIGG